MKNRRVNQEGQIVLLTLLGQGQKEEREIIRIFIISEFAEL